jgi:hypothetical protein
MARVLHLLKGDHVRDALDVVTPQVAAGDEVTVVLLGGAAPPALPPGVEVIRVPETTSYDELVALVFAADAVVTW